MTRILTTLHLSNIQKEVLAKVKASPNGHIAWEEITKASENFDQNFSSARDVLGNLGLLKVGEGTLEITEKGEEVMRDENIVDDMGELTDNGRQLSSINRTEPSSETRTSDVGSSSSDVGGGLPMESFGLLRGINESSNELERIKSFKR